MQTSGSFRFSNTQIPGGQPAPAYPLTAISAVIFLVSVNWSLLTVRILQCITELMFAEAAAFSVVLVAIVFAAIGCIDLIFRFVCPRSS